MRVWWIKDSFLLQLLCFFNPTCCRSIETSTYGSVAATFYLLAEAERHRKQQQQQQYILTQDAVLASPRRSRKVSMPAMHTTPGKQQQQ